MNLQHQHRDNQEKGRIYLVDHVDIETSNDDTDTKPYVNFVTTMGVKKPVLNRLDKGSSPSAQLVGGIFCILGHPESKKQSDLPRIRIWGMFNFRKHKYLELKT